ncbi:hypothetical protein J6590_036982 [Homalodisca vitripennis]|nr:hypothetical protein J6590_036982 [Homalodisca vitripennis]
MNKMLDIPYIILSLMHNALRGICPATVNLVTSVVSLPAVDSALQLTALKCFTVMVTVLHHSLPHERQIEVTTVLEKLREVMIEVMSRDQKTSVPTVLQLVHTLPNILAATNSMQSLQSLMVEAKLIDTLLDILDQTADCHKNHMELVVTIISALNKLVIGSIGGKHVRCLLGVGSGKSARCPGEGVGEVLYAHARAFVASPTSAKDRSSRIAQQTHHNPTQPNNTAIILKIHLQLDGRDATAV